MSSNNKGLQWVWRDKDIVIINDSTHTVYVTFGNQYPSSAVGVGCLIVYPVRVSMVTLSYYTDNRDLESVCIQSDGSWATSVIKMVHPSCYTKDCELNTGCIRRRVVRKPY